MWTVRVGECTKTLATMWFCKHEAAFVGGDRIAGDILQFVNGKHQQYIHVIKLKIGSKRATATCQGSQSLRLQSEWSTAGVGYRPRIERVEAKKKSSRELHGVAV